MPTSRPSPIPIGWTASQSTVSSLVKPIILEAGSARPAPHLPPHPHPLRCAASFIRQHSGWLCETASCNHLPLLKTPQCLCSALKLSPLTSVFSMLRISFLNSPPQLHSFLLFMLLQPPCLPFWQRPVCLDPKHFYELKPTRPRDTPDLYTSSFLCPALSPWFSVIPLPSVSQAHISVAYNALSFQPAFSLTLIQAVGVLECLHPSEMVFMSWE